MPSYDQVLIQNSGTVGGNGTADPTAVTDGEIEVFPSDNGASIDLSSGSYTGEDSILLALGGPGNEVTTTSILDTSKLSISKLTYTAPSAQVTTVNVGTVSADQELTIKVQNLEQGFQPFPFGNFTADALASDSEADIIAKFIDQILSRESSEIVNGEEARTVYAGTDQVSQVALASGTSGDSPITIDGIDYNANWDTDASTTADNFISNHKDTIWDRHGIRVTKDGSNNLDFAFVNTRLTHSDLSVSDGSTNLTLTEQQGITVLRLEAEDFGEIFTVATSADGGWDPTVTTTADPTEGNGTFDHIDEAFKDTYGSMSRYAQNTNLLGKLDLPDSPAASGNTYDVYVFRHENDNDRNINKSFEYQTILVAVESGLTTTNFDSWFGV